MKFPKYQWPQNFRVLNLPNTVQAHKTYMRNNQVTRVNKFHSGALIISYTSEG
jgi:hypothetical protein